MFKAIWLTRADDGATRAELAQLDDAQLPADADVMVRVDYSTVNYKDALAITGKAPVVRSWPMVPGIDGAGEVLASSHPNWKAGDPLILNGWGVGETHMGCLAQRARLKGDWLIRRPAAREQAWQRLATELGAAKLAAITGEISLAEALKSAADVLAGKVRGRLVVDVNR
jgi:acrylyl-CoA reductase (NADPH)